MGESVISARTAAVMAAMEGVSSFLSGSAYARRDPHDPANCDFVLGNPHEFPLPGFVEALRESLTPRDATWFAYKLSEPEATRVVAESLREWRGVPFEADDICLTTGAFGALSVAIGTLVDTDDEVIYISPPWFFYEPMIRYYGGLPVRVDVTEGSLDLDLSAIEAAITPRTRALIINTPHNPTGRIYPAEALEELARILTRAGERYGKPVYLISDESYSRIVFSGSQFVSPTVSYPHSLLIYTYGKTLLTPGQRIGFIALPPHLPGRRELVAALEATQFVNGFAFPNALLQHALPAIDRLSIDIAHLERKRDRLAGELSAQGYEVRLPEGTFYLLVRSPVADDLAFSDMLAARRVYILPGSVFELPGYFRISLTATDEMIERSLPTFAAVREELVGTAA